jgi:hypothetical protein
VNDSNHNVEEISSGGMGPHGSIAPNNIGQAASTVFDIHHHHNNSLYEKSSNMFQDDIIAPNSGHGRKLKKSQGANA